VYRWDFSPVWQHFGFLLGGLVETVALSVFAIAFGLAIGLVLAVMRLAPTRMLSMPAAAIITFYRNTPPLVHLFFFFYGLPILIGASLSPFLAALIALSIQGGAFFAEAFRGGILSIETGQWEAGRAIGMGNAALLRRIILPQAIRRMIPPLMERSFELVKTTPLAATLTYSELLYRAMALTSQTFRPLEIYTAVAMLFLVLMTLLSLLVRYAEARIGTAAER
jgi:polar amino acid transport system permease protein